MRIPLTGLIITLFVVTCVTVSASNTPCDAYKSCVGKCAASNGADEMLNCAQKCGALRVDCAKQSKLEQPGVWTRFLIWLGIASDASNIQELDLLPNPAVDTIERIKRMGKAPREL